MYLEGMVALLYDVQPDPKELDNRIDDPNLGSMVGELRMQVVGIIDGL